jgi:hypothetical protein
LTDSVSVSGRRAATSGPQQPQHEGAEQNDLGHALDEVDQRDLREQALEPGHRRDLGQLGLELLGRPHQPVLDHVAADRREHHQQERDRQHGEDVDAEPAGEIDEPAAVDPHPVRVAHQSAECRREP